MFAVGCQYFAELRDELREERSCPRAKLRCENKSQSIGPRFGPR